MGYTLEDLHVLLMSTDQSDVPRDLNKFRQRVAYFVRRGKVEPPVRESRPDGKGGTVGIYSVKAFKQLEDLTYRPNRRVSKRELLESPEVDDDGSEQQKFGVSFRVPKILGDRIVAQARAGHPVSELVWLGARLFHSQQPGIPWRCYRAFADGAGIRYSDEGFQWQYFTGVVLATHMLEVLDRITAKVREVEQKRWEKHYRTPGENEAAHWSLPVDHRGKPIRPDDWNFEFDVVEGRIRIVKVSTMSPSGELVEVEIDDA